MSSAAVNDSIRLFLNALVTPMGHSARESAHSAERAQTLAGHQRHSHAHTCIHTNFDTLTHTHIDIDGHAHTSYTPTISGVHSLIHLFVCSLRLWRVSVVDCLTIWEGHSFGRERARGREREREITYSSRQMHVTLSKGLHRNMKCATAMLLTTEMKYSWHSSRSDIKVPLKHPVAECP